MTFLENIEPLLKAAEAYAKAAKAYLDAEPGSASEAAYILRSRAEVELHAAAIEYAKWGTTV